jgi:phage terminase small subunit
MKSMPRQSAEARGAAAFRAGAVPLEPPKHLSKEAAALWLAITACKPPDWFDPASAVLLEEFCEVSTHLRALYQHLARLREAGAWSEAAVTERRWLRVGARLTTLATKLRLTVQAGVDRKSRMLDERGSGGAPRKRNRLLGLN